MTEARLPGGGGSKLETRNTETATADKRRLTQRTEEAGLTQRRKERKGQLQTRGTEEATTAALTTKTRRHQGTEETEAAEARINHQGHQGHEEQQTATHKVQGLRPKEQQQRPGNRG